MSKVETVSLRIFGRDLTIACPPKEKNNLIKAAASVSYTHLTLPTKG